MNIRGKIVEVGTSTALGDPVKLTIQTDRTRLSLTGERDMNNGVVIISQQDYDELQAYRHGGLTEELLRRNDGHIKVGKGCVLVSASLFNGLARKGEA